MKLVLNRGNSHSEAASYKERKRQN